jgi:hypothetical protein
VNELFGIGLACLLVVEEHPSVLTFDPPELYPEVSSLYQMNVPDWLW